MATLTIIGLTDTGIETDAGGGNRTGTLWQALNVANLNVGTPGTVAISSKTSRPTGKIQPAGILLRVEPRSGFGATPRASMARAGGEVRAHQV